MIQIGLKILDELKTLHDLGFVFLDLKPENITCKGSLIDFGYPTLIEGITLKDIEKCTKEYALKKERKIKSWEKSYDVKKLDIYSFGCILYFIIVKNDLWQSKTRHLHNSNDFSQLLSPSSIFQKNIKQILQDTRFKDRARQLTEYVEKCLATNHDKRFSTDEAIKQWKSLWTTKTRTVRCTSL